MCQANRAKRVLLMHEWNLNICMGPRDGNEHHRTRLPVSEKPIWTPSPVILTSYAFKIQIKPSVSKYRPRLLTCMHGNLCNVSLAVLTLFATFKLVGRFLGSGAEDEGKNEANVRDVRRGRVER